MEKKKLYIITIIILVLFLGSLLILLIFSKKSPPQEKPAVITVFPTITTFPSLQLSQIPISVTIPVQKITPKISVTNAPGKSVVSGVIVNDISKIGRVIDAKGDMVFSDDRRYQVMYLPLYKIFYVTVLEAPFAQNRILAENYFIKTLGITRDQSCRMTVYVDVSEVIDPKKGGKKYNLSWCTD